MCLGLEVKDIIPVYKYAKNFRKRNNHSHEDALVFLGKPIHGGHETGRGTETEQEAKEGVPPRGVWP